MDRVAAALAQHAGEDAGHCERDVLLGFAVDADRPRVDAAVSGIEDDHRLLRNRRRPRRGLGPRRRGAGLRCRSGPCDLARAVLRRGLRARDRQRRHPGRGCGSHRRRRGWRLGFEIEHEAPEAARRGRRQQELPGDAEGRAQVEDDARAARLEPAVAVAGGEATRAAERIRADAEAHLRQVEHEPRRIGADHDGRLEAPVEIDDDPGPAVVHAEADARDLGVRGTETRDRPKPGEEEQEQRAPRTDHGKKGDRGARPRDAGADARRRLHAAVTPRASPCRVLRGMLDMQPERTICDCELFGQSL